MLVDFYTSKTIFVTILGQISFSKFNQNIDIDGIESTT